MRKLLQTLAAGLVLVLAGGAQERKPPDAKPQASCPEPMKFENHPTELGDGAAEVLAIAYSPDRETMASGGADKIVRLWEVASGRVVGKFEGHADAVAGLAFSPDGKRLASASYDRSIRIWDLSNWRPGAASPPAKVLNSHKNWVFAAAFTPDGSRLVSVSYDRTVKVWDLASGQEKSTYTRHRGSV